MLDLSDVRGQRLAKRGLEVAAAGGHHLLLVGPPGAGKTMLARRLPALLPEPSQDEALEITAIHSAAGLLPVGAGLVQDLPFRAPHHTISLPALVGGGSSPRPGEASLAHRGVLFLDEVLEFRRTALDGLRQPLEEGRITIARAARVVVFPARFLLVGATHPCPCGFAGSSDRACRCTPHQIALYQGRLSGPLRDRLNLSVDVQAVPHALLASDEADPRCEGSAAAHDRITAARARQADRSRAAPGALIAQLSGAALAGACLLSRECTRLLMAASRTLRLSARAFDGVRRVARTVADLQQRAAITDEDIAEALQFRLDAFDPSSRDLRTAHD